MADSLARMQDIALEGDVVLLCGDPTQHLRIRVSSHSLMQGSPVFKAMLGPRFKEGNALATAKSAIEIPLLDDDTDAMTIVCSVLHLAYGKVPDTLELEKLLKVAALVDKYDCAMAFRPSAYRWLALPSWGLLVNSCPEKIVVAYHLQHEEIFESMCKDLVMHVRGKIDYAGTSSVDNCPDVLMNLFDALEAQRKTIVNEVAGIIDWALIRQRDIMKDAMYCSKTCPLNDINFGILIDSLRSRNLWPTTTLDERAIQHTLDAMKFMSIEDPSVDKNLRCVIGCSIYDTYQLRDFSVYTRRMHEKACELEEMPLICYNCIREGKRYGVDACNHKTSTSW